MVLVGASLQQPFGKTFSPLKPNKKPFHFQDSVCYNLFHSGCTKVERKIDIYGLPDPSSCTELQDAVWTIIQLTNHRRFQSDCGRFFYQLCIGCMNWRSIWNFPRWNHQVATRSLRSFELIYILHTLLHFPLYYYTKLLMMCVVSVWLSPVVRLQSTSNQVRISFYRALKWKSLLATVWFLLRISSIGPATQNTNIIKKASPYYSENKRVIHGKNAETK